MSSIELRRAFRLAVIAIAFAAPQLCTGDRPGDGMALAQPAPATSPTTTLSYPTLPANWQQLRLYDLTVAAEKFYDTNGRTFAGRPQRQQLAAFVWSKYLSVDQRFALAAAASPESLMHLATLVAPDLSSD